MKYEFHRVVVIGAGTMGAAIAAHFANAGIPSVLLDIIPDKLTPEEEAKGLTLQDQEVRNRIVNQGLARAVGSRPASFFTPEHAALVRTGNLEDDFGEIAQADWVIEVIVENLAIKRRLMERIDTVRKPETIITTNTSGIPIHQIAEGRSQSFREHFLGTHFFNPPRYLKLLEIIPGPDTSPEVVGAISQFAEFRLGKGIVLCKDTPNFIANRLGFGGGAFALDFILSHGYTVEQVDAITGPVLGRPKTATFRLIDLVGVDVWEHVGRNLAPAIPDDAQAQQVLQSEPVNTMIHTMVERGWLGTKTKVGFYKETRNAEGTKEFWPLNLQTLEHQPPQKVRYDSIGKAREVEELGERLKIMLAAQDAAGELVRALTYQGLSYAAERIPEIADTPKPLDDATRWGFGHEAGPFEIWDMLGVSETAEQVRQAGFPLPGWVDQMLKSGCTTFYRYEGDRKAGVYNPTLGDYQPIQRSDAILVLKELKSDGKVIQQNPGATLVDLGEGVICVEFNTKMNVFDDDVFNMIITALDRAEHEFEGVVIGNDADNFSAGANLMMIVMGAQSGMWDQLEEGIRKLQDFNMRIRYFPKPVVVAPAGLSLGGGAEVTMHASRVVAHAELYTGLVEVGMGLIPAGGGTKEMVRRILNPPMRTKNAEALAFLQRIFEQVGLAKVATSAEEARGMGILGPADRVVMNRDHLLFEARREVLHMLASGYHPPIPEQMYAAGRDALSALQVGIYMMKEGKYITEYESVIGSKLAHVMTGGDLSAPAWVSEQYFLDLEREAFLSLCGEEKTRQRIWNFLQTGKPLRN